MTVVVPPELPARAGVDTTNGVGELTAKLEIDEYGIIVTPVWLCGTHAVGTVYHGAVLAAGGSPDKTVIPVVGECDDSDMGDSLTVTVDDVNAALANAGDDVAEGTVGAGTGMTCFDFAGRDRHRVAARRGPHRRRPSDVQLRRPRAADGRRPAVRPGRPATRRPRARASPSAPPTRRSARSAAAAGAAAAARPRPGRLVRVQRVGRDRDRVRGRREQAYRTDRMSPLFAAAYEAAEESVYNCLVAAKAGTRRDGRPHEAFPKHLVKR